MVGNRSGNEREAKPRASLALAGARTKAQEGVGGPFRRQARAIVRDLDRRCLIARRHSELYLCGSVFDRIADQVVEYARQDRAVSRSINRIFAIMRHDLRPVIAGDRKGARPSGRRGDAGSGGRRRARHEARRARRCRGD